MACISVDSASFHCCLFTSWIASRYRSTHSRRPWADTGASVAKSSRTTSGRVSVVMSILRQQRIHNLGRVETRHGADNELRLAEFYFDWKCRVPIQPAVLRFECVIAWREIDRERGVEWFGGNRG